MNTSNFRQQKQAQFDVRAHQYSNGWKTDLMGATLANPLCKLQFSFFSLYGLYYEVYVALQPSLSVLQRILFNITSSCSRLSPALHGKLMSVVFLSCRVLLFRVLVGTCSAHYIADSSSLPRMMIAQVTESTLLCNHSNLRSAQASSYHVLPFASNLCPIS